ncbi:hypothetical protein Tco_0012242 [Tanacetum coccineum]
MIAIIFIASNFGNSHHGNSPRNLTRPPSMLERVKSVNLSSFYSTALSEQVNSASELTGSGSDQQQQQAATFQALFEPLRAELQASLGQLQGRPGGEDPEKRLFAITKYFSLLNTPADQRLCIVGFNLEGTDAEWFWWMSRNGLIIDWERFKESVMNRFGPSKYEDPQGALSKLLQLGIVEDYQARIIEARFDDQATPVAGTSAGLEANKVVNDGDDSESSGPVTPTSDSESSSKVKVLNWVQQSIDVESTYDNDARDQVSELEMKVLVDGKQDEAKVVKVVVVAVEQNID